MRNKTSFNYLGLATVAVGGYLLWINRFKVQQYLESNGISTPWITESATDAIRSGAAKISGSIEHGVRSVDSKSAL